MLAGERLAPLYKAPYVAQRTLVEVSHLLSLCGLSTRQIVGVLDEAKDAAAKNGYEPMWSVPTHATIGAWLKKDCPEAYS